MIKKTTAFIITFLSFFFPLFAIDTTISTTVDTYSENLSGGLSLIMKDNLLDSVFLTSGIEYDDNNSYDTYCDISCQNKKFTYGGSFGFYIEEKESIYPQFSIKGSVLPFNFFQLKLEQNIKLASNNIFSYSEAIIETTLASYLYTSTSDIIFDFRYINENEDSSIDTIYKGKFEILGHQEGIPVQIDMYTQANLYFESNETSPNNVDIIVGGGLILDLQKKGTYFLMGNVTPFSYEKEYIPYSLTLGATFKTKNTVQKKETYTGNPNLTTRETTLNTDNEDIEEKIPSSDNSISE